MFIIRFLGKLICLVAIIVAAIDLWWFATGSPLVPSLVEGLDEPHMSTLGEWWNWIHTDSLQLAQAGIERHLAPVLWDPVMLALLGWPLAAELAVIGILLWLMGRRRAYGA